MSQVCPTCQSALDPAHAPVARIVAAKVVAYCSITCADHAGDSHNTVAKKISGDSTVKEAEVEKVADEDQVPDASPAVELVEVGEESLAEEARRSDRRAARKLSYSRRKRVLWGCAAVFVGGMVLAILPSVSPGSSSEVRAAETSAAARIEVEPALKAVETKAEETRAPTAEESPVLSPQQLRAVAVAELEVQLSSDSARFQRVAGMALARISHAKAIDVLLALLKREKSDLARIDVAYGLSLAGNSVGTEYLVRELKSKRRDVRIDAGRRLAQLHNDAGRGALLQMVNVRSHRLGAASVLALLGDAKGIEVLYKALQDPKSSEENRMRAAVGLGRSGDPKAQERLRTILSEGRFVVDAAGALAVLKDAAAIPALQRQLDLTALRVGAAEGLVAMEQSTDLSGLRTALLTSNAEGRIAAAEAILILTENRSVAEGKSEVQK